MFVAIVLAQGLTPLPAESSRLDSAIIYILSSIFEWLVGEESSWLLLVFGEVGFAHQRLLELFRSALAGVSGLAVLAG